MNVRIEDRDAIVDVMKRGCLIVTLGSPASPEPAAIKEFLHSFLSDASVVDMPRWLWKPVLHGIILRVRPRKISPIYQSVWTDEGSPLIVHTRAQSQHLHNQLPEVTVGFATTYTEPSIAEAITAMDVDEVVVIPLYPHYAPSTVADIWRQLDTLEANSSAPRIIRAEAWHSDQLLVDWYAKRIHTQLAQSASPIDKIVFSYHGVPQRASHQPEEYRQQCEATTRAIVERLGEVNFEMTYQSKFGPGAWLQPATINRMAQLPGEGVENLLVVTPGFFASCIETLDEIGVLNRRAFLDAGGKNFTMIAPPDSDPIAGEILANVYRTALKQ